jgi:flagellar biosynthesis protein FlhA|tara:strand:+ start:24719 stop:26815 length:2097 start_codon:yes stop_codon:yes gene_type:complete
MSGRFSLKTLSGASGTAVMPALILVLIALLVVPVPAALLDIFFILNILVSLLVLMLSLGAGRPLEFSSFPTVLLFATLLRLALNVASTRVVLVSGHEGPHAAGQVIQAFGSFIIAGNYVVGLFVFAILVIINLVVITKGAGRVSEVSARFTLDALPGKQMAIDADLAAGLLNSDEAKARRQEVATEADFYGAMDGASKFVKGDAVAGLLVLAINIFGGLILGMTQHGLSFGDAASTYITLSIGDGLVAQIPSLLLSIAAAAIVTRVSSADTLSDQVSSQFSHARAWMPVAVILGILGFVPGMPHILLFAFAGVSGYIAWRLMQAKNAPTEVEAAPAEGAQPSATTLDWDDIIDHTQLTLEIGFGLIDLVGESKGSPLTSRITGIRRQVSQRLGFLIPQCRIRDSLDLGADGYNIVLGSELLASGTVRNGKLLALDSGNVLGTCEGEDTLDPAFGLPAKWIDAGAREQALACGYTVVDVSTVIATHLSRVIGSNAHRLFGQEEASRMVDALAESAPKLAENLMPGTVSLQQLTAILQRLLMEDVSIRDFRRMAEAICAAGVQTQNPAQLTEHVRRALGPLIVQSVAGPSETLNVVTFGAPVERLLSDCIGSDPEAGHRAIEPGLAQQIIASISTTAQELAARDSSFAVVTSPRLRSPVFMLLQHHLPDIVVLSFDEVPEDKAINVVSVIEPALESGDVK